MLMNFKSQLILSELQEEMALTKLSNSIAFKRAADEFYVVVQGVVVPYRIFLLILFKIGLWHIRMKPQDWLAINHDLMKLWTELGIVPADVSFDPKPIDDKTRSKTKIPLTVVKKVIDSVELDSDFLEFFKSNNILCPYYEALLYYVEQEYIVSTK